MTAYSLDIEGVESRTVEGCEFEVDAVPVFGGSTTSVRAATIVGEHTFEGQVMQAANRAGTTDVGTVELQPPQRRVASVVAQASGSNATFGGLLYTMLVWAPGQSAFLTANIEGFDRVTKISPDSAPPFVDLAVRFGLGGVTTGGLAAPGAGAFAYVAEGHTGTVFLVEPSRHYPIADDLRGPANTRIAPPLIIGRDDGSALVRFDAQWYTVSQDAGAAPAFTTAADEQALAPSMVAHELFVAAPGELRRLDVRDGTGTFLAPLPFSAVHLARAPTADVLFAIDGAKGLPIGINAGTTVHALDTQGNLRTALAAPPGHAFGGLAFGPGGAGASLYVLQTNLSELDSNTPVDVALVELSGDFGADALNVAPPWPPYADADADRLSDALEESHRTSSITADTDGDGISDFLEVAHYHTDPTVQDSERVRCP